MPQSEPIERPPWGDLFAEVSAGGEATAWVPLCPVYRADATSKAAITFEMYSEPVAWRDPTVPRRLMIVKRPEIKQ
jgi:hypothetical protein